MPRSSLLAALALVTACAGAGDTGSDSLPATGSDTAAMTTTASSTGTTPTTSTGESSTSAGTTDVTTTAGTMDLTTTSMASTTGGDPSTTGTTGGVIPGGCTAEALALVDLVNTYRGENGLPAIPASPSLCTVGHTHVVDLVQESPHSVPGCNLHSWSDAGSWSPCCYTDDHAQAMCMWLKPQELTIYPGYGYENAAGAGGVITPQQALDGWKNSPPHNEVILNQGIWADHPWKAVGAGLHQGYAVLWFGEQTDPAG